MMCYFFFFVKQKTAYEMRISDWSSDVCSSDLKGDGRVYQQQWGVAMQYLRLLQSNVRDNPPQAALVAKLTAELERRGEQLGDAALRANSNQTIAAISKYNAVGHDPALDRKSPRLNSIH